MSRAALWFALFLAACGGSTEPPRPPTPAPAATTIRVEAADPTPPPREDGRLPPGVRPTRYRLDLTIDPTKKSFAGRAELGVAIERPTRAIVLHGPGLTIRSATLRAGGATIHGDPRPRAAAGIKGQLDELVVQLDETAPAGEAELDFEYEAPFSDQLRGAYRVDEGGASYVFTQFEAIDARRAFPCFDEPGFKTPFEIAITAPKGSLAFANTKLVAQKETSGGLVRFEFEKTPPLPTYLVAFAVGPFDVLEGPKDPVPIRLITTKGKTGLGKIALEMAPAYVGLLGKYFDRPYPYSKLDLLAVPNFAFGAMENAGLITFREELLLVDPEHASVSARRGVAIALAHELSHQWFGDLVTMSWWDDIWLNESFASWLSSKIVDEYKPEMEARLDALGGKPFAMGLDSLPTARKIRNPVRNMSDVAETGAAGILYVKGEAVLGMIETWLGEEAFRDGMRRYVKKHEWGSVTSADLYAALTEVGHGQDVARTMDSFTDQAGVPLVSARLDCSGKGPALLELRQEEYRTLDRKAPSDKLWKIPVCAVYEAGGALAKGCTLLDGREGRLELGPAGSPRTTCPAFFYPNAGENGYYRVHLDRADLERLTGKALAKLPARERLGLVVNAWADVAAGHLPASSYLQFLQSFKSEKSRLVWQQVIDSLYQADVMVISDRARPAFAKLVRNLLGPAAQRLGWTPAKGEPEEQAILRSMTLYTLGRLGEDAATVAQAKRVASTWLGDPKKINPDLARPALGLSARHGDAALFDRLVALVRGGGDPQVRSLALSGLAQFQDRALVERALGLMLDGTLREGDAPLVLVPLLRDRTTASIANAWVEQHFDELTKVLPSHMLGTLARAAGPLCSAERVRSIETFLKPRLEKIGAGNTFQSALEDGLRCAALADKERNPTESWLLSSPKL
jgi:alanyl aminopeptidase